MYELASDAKNTANPAISSGVDTLPSEQFFKKMNLLSNELDLNELSMGMSSDYLEAAKHGSTYVRVGSKIFGSRS